MLYIDIQTPVHPGTLWWYTLAVCSVSADFSEYTCVICVVFVRRKHRVGFSAPHYGKHCVESSFIPAEAGRQQRRVHVSGQERRHDATSRNHSQPQSQLYALTLSLTFDIPKRDQVSPFSSVIPLTWRCPFRPSADVCVELYTTVFDINFVKCPLNCVMAAL